MLDPRRRVAAPPQTALRFRPPCAFPPWRPKQNPRCRARLLMRESRRLPSRPTAPAPRHRPARPPAVRQARAGLRPATQALARVTFHRRLGPCRSTKHTRPKHTHRAATRTPRSHGHGPVCAGRADMLHEGRTWRGWSHDRGTGPHILPGTHRVAREPDGEPSRPE